MSRTLFVALTLLLSTLSGFAREIPPDATIDDIGELSILLEPSEVRSVLVTSDEEENTVEVNPDEAARIAWESFTSAYGIAGTPIGAGVGIMAEAGNVHFKGINDALTEIGGVMAFYQLYVDLTTDNADKAGLNFIKSASFYSASKWGWKALRIATISITLIDYALTTTATVVLHTRWANWEKAFIQYHENEKRPGYRNIREWERVFVKLSKREGGPKKNDIQAELDRYLDTFWEGDTSEYFQYKLQGEPPVDEKKAIKARYMKERLIPYLTPLLNEMNLRTRMELREHANELSRKLRIELNELRTLQVQVIGPPERVGGLPIEIGPWGGATNGEGKYNFNYTLWGYLNGGSPKVVQVHPPDDPVMNSEAKFLESRERVTFNIAPERKAAVATLKATVLDKSTGEPLSGAEVELRSATHSARGTSDGQGRVVIENLPYGKYTVNATRSKYKPLSPQSLNLAKEVNSGKIRLKPIEENDNIRTPPRFPPTPEPPTPESGPCEYKEIASFDGTSGEDVIRQEISSDEHVFSGAGHQVNVPGPGTLKVSIRTTGKHEVANDEYGYTRYSSKIVLSSPQGAVSNTAWIGGGRFYPGVTDYGTNSASWPVNNAGEINLRFVPERCYIREYEGKIRCYVPGSTQIPGIKLLPTSYELKVEFKPCQ